jgi:hypothetical protein
VEFEVLSAFFKENLIYPREVWWKIEGCEGAGIRERVYPREVWWK